MTTWVRARQATVTSRGNKWSQRRVTLPHPPLYKSGEITCPSTLAKKNGGSRRACSPSRIAERSVFETVPARLSGSTSSKNGGSPRCRPVLCGLRDRCIAAMLATRKSGSQWSCSTTSRSRSVRLPTGGGTLVRFNFQQKWSLRLDSHQHLTAYETAALLYATERKNSIRQPDLHRPLPVTNGVRRFLHFGGF